MVNSADFTKRLQNILDYYGLSATAFSEKIYFNRSTISHLLSGRNKPSLEFIMKVLQEFPEVELYWLLNGKGTFPTAPIPEKKIAPSKEKDIPSKIPENFNIEKSNESAIERIIIFFKDGSFKSYQ